MLSFSKISCKANIIILVALCASMRHSRAQSQVNPTGNSGAATTSYLMEQARALLESGMGKQITPQQQDMFAALYPNSNPQTIKSLNDNINKVTELINNYRQHGLSNMPSLPSLPGLNSVMRVPDKLLRAELSMLQDEIRMAQDMMQNPISATLNAPKDLATMLQRMAQQLEQ